MLMYINVFVFIFCLKFLIFIFLFLFLYLFWYYAQVWKCFLSQTFEKIGGLCSCHIRHVSTCFAEHIPSPIYNIIAIEAQAVILRLKISTIRSGTWIIYCIIHYFYNYFFIFCITVMRSFNYSLNIIINNFGK